MARTDAPRPSLMISSRRIIPVAPQAVFAFLADLENPWRMAADRAELVRLDGPPGAHDGARVRLGGPLRLRRTIEVRMIARVEPTHVVALARAGRTVARIKWTLTPLPAATGVELSVEADSVALIDRVLLAAGGRRWIERTLTATLATLGDVVRVAAAGTDLDDARSCAAVLVRVARETSAAA
jgi:hypothetical protein